MSERQTLRHLERKQPALLEALYETVERPEAWQVFLERLVDASDGRSARLLVLNDRADRVEASYKVNIDENAHEAYVRHFVNACPWRPELSEKKPGRLYSTHVDFSCPQREYYRTEFFNDWARELDIHHGICGTVFQLGSQTVQLLVQRTRGQGHFTATETEALNRLVPHVQRSLGLATRLEALRQQVAATNQAIDHHGLPFLLLGEHGQVNFASAQAQRIIEADDKLCIAGNRLSIGSQPLGRVLRRHISRQIGNLEQGWNRPSCLRLPRANHPDLQLILTPLHPDMPAMQLGPVTSSAIVYLHDPLFAPEIDRDLLSELYGLTVAEARTAALVAQGLDVSEIAIRSGASAHTIRTQLKQCFRKTGTRRQAELTRLLLVGGAQRPRVERLTPGNADIMVAQGTGC